MKPQLLKVSYNADHSFSIRKETEPNINNRWHFHPEIELIHFHQGCGTQFIGDHISKFEPGDVIIIGRDLPHFWKYDDLYHTVKPITEAYSTVIHFFENFIGERFLHLPESRGIKSLLEKATRGILLKGAAADKIGELMEKIYESKGLHRIISLLNCLSELALCEDITLLSSLGFKHSFPESQSHRISAIYNYTLNNFNKTIKLDEIAEIAGMIPNSFCRYFKDLTGKTYFTFLAEIRIGYACKLLLANKASVKQICFESGFNNFSSFHKSFKLIMGKTPIEYKNEYQ